MIKRKFSIMLPIKAINTLSYTLLAFLMLERIPEMLHPITTIESNMINTFLDSVKPSRARK